MTNYVAFYYVDADTAATHLLALDPVAREWRVPCGLIPRPTTNQITYAPAKPMCRLCTRFTTPRITRRIAPRTRRP